MLLASLFVFLCIAHVDGLNHRLSTVFGGGAFSLALAQALAHNNIYSTLLVRNQSVADAINTERFHPKYLRKSRLPPQLSATTSPEAALADATHIIHAVPMQDSRAFLQSMKRHIDPSIPIISATKGVELGSFALMSDIISETLGPMQRTAYLSGPSFAQEIMDGLATAVVIASQDAKLAEDCADLFSSMKFRCHISNDVKGVELAGAIKNVIALAAGMCEGLELGMNAMSSLVTRGCVEMSSMGKLLGANPNTFYGLAGVGDTFGTCLSPLSRNRKVGFRLAKGESLEYILNSLDGVSEGVSTVLALEEAIKTLVKSSTFDFRFPIISSVAKIIKGRMTPKMGLEVLMRYPLRNEDFNVFS